MLRTTSKVSLPAFLALLFFGLVVVPITPSVQAQDFSNLSWSLRNIHTDADSGTATAVDALDDVRVVLTTFATAPPRAWVDFSTDNGDTWTKSSDFTLPGGLDTGEASRDVTVIDNNSWTVLYISNTDLIAQTTDDAGQTWTERTIRVGNFVTSTISSHKDGTIREIIRGTQSAGSVEMFWTTDRWATVNGPIGIGPAVAHTRGDVSMLDLNTAFTSVPGGSSVAVYKSTDGGASWADVGTTHTGCSQTGYNIQALTATNYFFVCGVSGANPKWFFVSGTTIGESDTLHADCTNANPQSTRISASSVATAANCQVTGPAHDTVRVTIFRSSGTTIYTTDALEQNGSAQPSPPQIGYATGATLVVSWSDEINGIGVVATSNEGDCPADADYCYKDFARAPSDLETDWQGGFIFAREEGAGSQGANGWTYRFTPQLVVGVSISACHASVLQAPVNGRITVTQDTKTGIQCLDLQSAEGQFQAEQIGFYETNFVGSLNQGRDAATGLVVDNTFSGAGMGTIVSIRSHSMAKLAFFTSTDIVVYDNLLQNSPGPVWAQQPNTVRAISLDDSPESSGRLFATGAFGTKGWGYSGALHFKHDTVRGHGIAVFDDTAYISFGGNISTYNVTDTGLSFVSSNTTFNNVKTDSLKVSRDGDYITFIQGSTAYLVQSNNTSVVQTFNSPSGNTWTEVMLDAANNYLYGIDPTGIFAYQVSSNTTYFGAAPDPVSGSHTPDESKYTETAEMPVSDETTGTTAGGFVTDGGSTFFGVGLQNIATQFDTSLTAVKWLVGLFLITLLAIRFGVVIGAIGAVLGALFGFLWAVGQGFLPLWSLYVVIIFGSFLLGKSLFGGSSES